MERDIQILIVDDSKGMRVTLSDVFAEEGYSVTCAETIEEGRDKIRSNFYNIVLLDIKLPGGSGLDLLKEIRSKDKDIMAIIFTGYPSLDSSIRALNEGAFAYLQKPLSIDELKVYINKALGVQRLSWQNKALLSRLQELSLKDSHTELYNHRYLMERLTSELNRSARHGLSLSVIMVDIDYFKSINDVYGHKYGDFILKNFAHFLKKHVRQDDVVVRYGGEEFVLILPETDNKGAAMLSGRVLDSAKAHIFDEPGKKMKLKISLGIATYPENTLDADSPANIIDLADKALAHAKDLGGNRTFSFTDMPKDDDSGEDIKDNVNRLKDKLRKVRKRATQSLMESIYAFAKTLEARDYYTAEHAEHMTAIVNAVCKRMKIPPQLSESIMNAAVLHDLGKVGIPDNILNKKGKLTGREFTAIQKHPQIGAEIVRVIHFLKELAPLILFHHERFDGKGYPTGLKGRKIPVGARIIAVADVYQALISDRPYRKAMSKKAALKIIKDNSGKQFDPAVVQAFLSVVEEI
jgi:diguanylate cyclase (GGDEF)-like protein